MISLSKVFLCSLVLTSVSAVPIKHQKRIAQVIADSTHDWEQACLKAGGGTQCNPISQTAFTSLLAAGKNCDQQNAADQMIDLAKQLKSDPEMIRLTQIFVQQPRNAPDSLQVPYCQTAPKNAELNGLFHCEFAGSDFTKFSGDQTGNVPLGLSAVSPPGSCPAKTDGPVPDGVQLNTLVTSPGSPSSTSGSAGSAASSKASSASRTATATASAVSATASAANNTGSSGAATGSNSKSFLLQNGKDAQALNAKFATLSAGSSCTNGDNACINGDFAQCVNGKFVTSPCSGGLQCVALPLVNSAGTSTTCDTQTDAIARIAATGATGGLTGSGSTNTSSATPATSSAAPATSSVTPATSSAAPATSSVTPATSSAAPATSSPAAANNAAANNAAAAGNNSKPFTLTNGQTAQALNAKFATLTANSSCTAGENACVNGGFAQCVNGKFVVTPCSGGLQCVALPLVNSAGTSTTCDTQADAIARIAASGATGGLTGSK